MELNIDTNCITYLKSLQSLPLQQAVSLWDNLKEKLCKTKVYETKYLHRYRRYTRLFL